MFITSVTEPYQRIRVKFRSNLFYVAIKIYSCSLIIIYTIRAKIFVENKEGAKIIEDLQARMQLLSHQVRLAENFIHNKF